MFRRTGFLYLLVVVTIQISLSARAELGEFTQYTSLKAPLGWVHETRMSKKGRWIALLTAIICRVA